MTSELLTRMARWLAYLEPEFFQFSDQTDFTERKIVELWRRKEWDNEPILKQMNDGAIDLDQDRLFGACVRAAIARSWQPKMEVCDDYKTFYTAIYKSKDFGRSYQTPDGSHCHTSMGIAMAVSLIKAHCVEDWGSHDPTFPEETK
jgi:hypothetical protein